MRSAMCFVDTGRHATRAGVCETEAGFDIPSSNDVKSSHDKKTHTFDGLRARRMSAGADIDPECTADIAAMRDAQCEIVQRGA